MNDKLVTIEALFHSVIIDHPASILIGFLLGMTLYNVFNLDKCIRLNYHHILCGNTLGVNYTSNLASLYIHVVYALLYFGLTLITAVIAF